MCLSWDRNLTDFTTPAVNRAENNKSSAQCNQHWTGALVFTLNRPMHRSITLAVNVLRSSGDMGEHVALGAHESDWRHNLGQ